MLDITWSITAGLTAQCFSIAGLGLDIFGVVLLFWYSPEKHPDPQWNAGFRVANELREPWRRGQSRRRKVAGLSLFLIVTGFALQLVGEAVTAGWLTL